MTQTTFNQRFKAFAKSFDLKAVDIARKSGMDRQSVDKYLKTTMPSLEKLVAIVSAFPQLNVEWLIMDKGKMLKEGNELTVEEPATDYQRNDISLMRKMWEQDRAEMQRLREINHELTQQLLSFHNENNSGNGKSKSA